uniref:Uncharacterized protein n=1 Tax=Chenopodium quinoa TaxID=63459 RepID=A0A803MJ44_CHEQI
MNPSTKANLHDESIKSDQSSSLPSQQPPPPVHQNDADEEDESVKQLGDCSSLYLSLQMDSEAARTARDSLELAFQMSNILETGLDRHSLSVLIALCDLGLNPEAVAAVVKELRREPPPSSTIPPDAPAHS